MAVMKTYRPWEPDRTYLLPPSTRDWLPEDHLASFLLDVVEQLDLIAIESRLQQKDPRGEKPYAPRMLVALLLYGYCTGTFSSRRLAQATWTDLGARVIAAEEHPHFTTLNRFRLEHHEALGALFVQVLALCQRAGLVQLGHVALDGTKLQANASKHKAMSYERMKKDESRLQAEVDALLAKAHDVDQAEDETFGPEHDGNQIPDELRRRQTRLARIGEAKAALEREAAEARRLELEEQAQRARETALTESDPKEAAKLFRRAAARRGKAADIGGTSPLSIPGAGDALPFHQVAHDADGVPKPKAQRNFTDPDSRIMHAAGSYLQAYNGQLAVDEAHQIIVAQLLTNQSPDNEHLRPLLDQVQTNLGALPRQATADAGFWSEDNAQYCANREVDAYLSTRRRRHEEPLDGSEPATPPPKAAQTEAGRAMEAKVTSEAGRKVYAKRKWVVEPVFGQIKSARGFRRFSLRGLRKARAEFALVCATHNLLKLWRNAR
jgi:transposase